MKAGEVKYVLTNAILYFLYSVTFVSVLTCLHFSWKTNTVSSRFAGTPLLRTPAITDKIQPSTRRKRFSEV